MVPMPQLIMLLLVQLQVQVLILPLLTAQQPFQQVQHQQQSLLLELLMIHWMRSTKLLLLPYLIRPMLILALL